MDDQTCVHGTYVKMRCDRCEEAYLARFKIELKSLTVPNFVIPVGKPSQRQEGFKPTEGIPIGDLDEDTLSTLCDEFRANLFAKAGKTDPKS